MVINSPHIIYKSCMFLIPSTHHLIKIIIFSNFVYHHKSNISSRNRWQKLDGGSSSGRSQNCGRHLLQMMQSTKRQSSYFHHMFFGSLSLGFNLFGQQTCGKRKPIFETISSEKDICFVPIGLSSTSLYPCFVLAFVEGSQCPSSFLYIVDLH